MNIKTIGAAVVGAAAIGLSVGVASVEAVALNNSTGLANPAITITFDEVPLPTNTVVTNQYAAYGVTFSGLFYNPQDFPAPNVASPNLGNYIFPTSSAPFPSFSIKFLEQRTAAAFALLSNPGSSTFTALLNGAIVDSFNASTGFSSPTNFYGFTNILFDEIQVTVSSDNNAALIDNLQFASVPEPVPTPALLPGLIGMGVAALRKRKQEQKEVVEV